MEAKHPASDKKRRRLRQAGDVAAVGDLPTASAALAAGLLVLVALPALVESLATLAREVLANPAAPDRTRVLAALGKAGALTAAGCAALALAGFLPAWMATGFLWATGRLGRGLSLGPPRFATEASIGPLVAGLALVAGSILGIPSSLEAARLAPWPAARSLVLQGMGAGTLVACLVGVGGWLRARYVYEARIAMTDAEKRREVEEEEGSAEVRRWRREATERLMGTPAAGGAAPRTGTLVRPAPIRPEV